MLQHRDLHTLWDYDLWRRPRFAFNYSKEGVEITNRRGNKKIGIFKIGFADALSVIEAITVENPPALEYPFPAWEKKTRTQAMMQTSVGRISAWYEPAVDKGIKLFYTGKSKSEIIGTMVVNSTESTAPPEDRDVLWAIKNTAMEGVCTIIARHVLQT